MKRLFILILLSSCTTNNIKPPLIKGIEAVDVYHGQEIKDSYRNLENLKDSTVIKWLGDQNKYANCFLDLIPNKSKITNKLKSYSKKNDLTIIRSRETLNGKLFIEKINNNDTFSKLFYKKTRSSEEILLFDPALFSKKIGKKYNINYFKPDWIGKNIAISLSITGEEISKIIIIDIDTKEQKNVILSNARPSIGGIQWLSDNSGFTYIYHPNTDPLKPNYGMNSRSVLYKLDYKASELNEVFSKKVSPETNMNSEDYPKVYVYDGTNEYIFGQVSGSSRFKDMYYKESKYIDKSHIAWKSLYTRADKVEKMQIYENEIYFLSAKDNPSYELYKTSLSKPNFSNAEKLISGKKNNILSDFAINGDGLYFVRLKNGIEAKLLLLRESKISEIDLPKSSGSISISAVRNNEDQLHVYSVGWLEEGNSYRYDFSKNHFQNINLTPKKNTKEFENFEVKEIEVESHDGAMVPLSIIYNKNIKLNGENPTLFYGYGSYGGSGSPFYSPSLLTWVSEGGILAIAHVRGGREKGDSWYWDGIKSNKPNTWKDMIACTEYMIEKNYTAKDKTVIMGSSAGGIMAGRAITERPDLYKAAILISPAMNMLRSEIQPNGKNSIKEFGTVEVKEEFEALLEMDSYHQIKQNVKYPTTLVTAGMKDGRVVIWDPAKFVAKLQRFSSHDNPVLFSVDFDAGHGAMNTSRDKIYETYSKLFSFGFWQTGHPDYQPKN